jgi:hypothetical protein
MLAMINVQGSFLHVHSCIFSYPLFLDIDVYSHLVLQCKSLALTSEILFEMFLLVPCLVFLEHVPLLHVRTELENVLCILNCNSGVRAWMRILSY